MLEDRLEGCIANELFDDREVLTFDKLPSEDLARGDLEGDDMVLLVRSTLACAPLWGKERG